MFHARAYFGASSADERGLRSSSSDAGGVKPRPYVAAKQVGHNLRVEPDKRKRSIRGSAFFLPQKYRKDSEVELIARNRARNRILLEVSDRCGRHCGEGYYIVLRKDGTDWHDALIRMAWIS